MLLRTSPFPTHPPRTTQPRGRRSASASGRTHLALDHLGRQVVKCSAECRAPRMRRVHRPTKVCNLELAPEVEQQVLWLDVAVDHVLGVAVVERAGQRLDVLPQQGRGGVKAGSSASGTCGPRLWLGCGTRAGARCTLAERFSSNFPHFCSSLYSSPLAANSRIR